MDYKFNAFDSKQWEEDKRDYKTSDLIAMWNTEMPESFSLWQYIPYTHNQGKLWSCTTMGTNVSMEIQNSIEYDEYIELQWLKFRSEVMEHSATEYDWWDSVADNLNNAVSVWFVGVDEKEYKADLWSYDQRALSDNLKIKQTLYKWIPIIMVINWNSITWAEMWLWEVKTTEYKATWWHCVVIVGWDSWWFWFLNSWTPNDDDKKKSRFYITYDNLWKLFDNKKIWRRYFILTDKKQINTWITLERYKELVIAKANIEEIMPKLQTIIELPLVQTFKDETIGYVNVCSAKLKDIENELNKYK